MASVAEAGRSARYGSAAEIAAYAGVSEKTVRRLVVAGKVRGLKLGRRLLIPFDDLDAHVLEAGARKGRPTVEATITQPSFDARGRAIPLPPDKERRRALEAIRALDELDKMGDEEEQRATLRALMQGLNENRLSYRPRFAE